MRVLKPSVKLLWSTLAIGLGVSCLANFILGHPLTGLVSFVCAALATVVSEDL